MQDLYTRFTDEFGELVKDSASLFGYLSGSFMGADDDLKRIRKVYSDFTDLKEHYKSKNEAITKPEERSYREDFQDKKALNNWFSEQIDPFIELFQFVIELYEENR